MLALTRSGSPIPVTCMSACFGREKRDRDAHELEIIRVEEKR
jgi:hypothetical protein